jgi:hypothetical protein
VLDPVEVTMKEDSDDCIPRSGVFSTLATDGYRIPLFRGDLMPRHGDNRLRSISMQCGIVLRIIDELNAAFRNNDFATTEETRIK